MNTIVEVQSAFGSIGKWLVVVQLSGKQTSTEDLAVALSQKVGSAVVVTDIVTSLLSASSFRAFLEVENIQSLRDIVGEEFAGCTLDEIVSSTLVTEDAGDVASSASSIQGIMRGKAARKDAMAQMALLEGVTKWLVKLRLIGDIADTSSVASALSEKTGLDVTVTDVEGSLLSKTNFRASVEVTDLDKLANVVGEEVSGFVVDGIEDAEPVSEDPAVAAAASSIQAVMRGKVAREEALEQLILLTSPVAGYLITVDATGSSTASDMVEFETAVQAAAGCPVTVCDITTSLLSKSKCRIQMKMSTPAPSHFLVGQTICGLEVMALS